MMQRTQRYQVIVFDAGGTLIAADWQRVTDGLAVEAARQGLSVRAADVMDSLRRVWQEVLEGVIRDSADSPEAVTHFWHNAMVRALTLAAGETSGNDGHDKPRAQRTAEAFYPIFDTGIYHRLIDGVPETLEALAGAGYRLGLLSNWSPNLPRLLERFAIDHYFEFVIVSALVGLAKPDRAIFDLASQTAECRPDQLLYVGDSPANDIAASRAAGWDSVLIGRRTAAPVPLGVGSLTELPALLDGLQRDHASHPV